MNLKGTAYIKCPLRVAPNRLQSRANLPQPSSWNCPDCLNWLSCVDLDEVCAAAERFLADGRSVTRGNVALPMRCKVTYCATREGVVENSSMTDENELSDM